jgi:hypothetical protein
MLGITESPFHRRQRGRYVLALNGHAFALIGGETDTMKEPGLREWYNNPLLEQGFLQSETAPPQVLRDRCGR